MLFWGTGINFFEPVLARDLEIVLGVPKPEGRAVRNNCDEVKREAERTQRAGRRNSARSSAKRMEAEKREPPLTKSDLSLALNWMLRRVYVWNACRVPIRAINRKAWGFESIARMEAQMGEILGPTRVRYLEPGVKTEARFAVGDGKYGLAEVAASNPNTLCSWIAWSSGGTQHGHRFRARVLVKALHLMPAVIEVHRAPVFLPELPGRHRMGIVP